jgi:hypothetical protein
MRTSILTEEQAIEVFKQRPAQRTERAALCSVLADRYCVTTTAIRHIWDRRTWVWTNIPYWTQEEMAASLAEGTCEACRCKAQGAARASVKGTGRCGVHGAQSGLACSTGQGRTPHDADSACWNTFCSVQGRKT